MAMFLESKNLVLVAKYDQEVDVREKNELEEVNEEVKLAP